MLLHKGWGQIQAKLLYYGTSATTVPPPRLLRQVYDGEHCTREI